ncbi:hypothetical protein HY485_03565, partial [Candidatus Woesearchaeota archaeon]|nr:hypothetical protein [Candidatus Woesearchaeota archaeon]
MDFFPRLWTPEKLKLFVKQRPLVPVDVDYFVNNLLKKVIFLKCVENAFIHMDNSDNRKGYIVKIGLGYSQEERKIALVHEIVHAAYAVFPPLMPADFCDDGCHKELESIVESEAQRFCQDNKEFVDKVY